MSKGFWFACLAVVAALAIFIAGPALATQKAPTLVSYKETKSLDQYAYTTPSLASLGTDTCVVTIALPHDIPYCLVSDVPTWRILVGGKTATANVDSMKCEIWLGRTSKVYRNNTLTGVLNAKQKAFDITLYPLPTFRTLTFYITNGDSTAASFDLDIGILKGWLP